MDKLMQNPGEVPVADAERVRYRLVTHGVSATPQRVEVGQVLLACAQHLSAEQILERLRAAGSRVSKATVYNTLNLFVERGLVNAITIDPSRVYYDSTNAPHHHFYNLDTGELTDIAPGDVEFSRLPSLPDGTVPDGVHVVIQVRGNPAKG